MAAALAGSPNVQTKDRELTVAEERALKAMSLEEVCIAQLSLSIYSTSVSVSVYTCILYTDQGPRTDCSRGESTQSHESGGGMYSTTVSVYI